MLNKMLYKLLGFFLLLSVAPISLSVNFTYDGINRRDPEGDIEIRTFAAVGQTQCTHAKTGGLRDSTGFLLDIGQTGEFAIVMSSGHVMRNIEDNEYNRDCVFLRNGARELVSLDNLQAGDLAQDNPAVLLRNDWGLNTIQPSPFPQYSITVSELGFAELMALLMAGAGEIKLYSMNQNPEVGPPRIQVSDQCSIWQPTPNAILGANHSLYTNCDSSGSGSGGALVFEYNDGRVEAVGIMSGSVQTDETVRRILGENPENLSFSDVRDSIDIIPSPGTIINIAVPLIPDMRHQVLNELFDELKAL